MKVKVKGLIVYDVKERQYDFFTNFPTLAFENGVFRGDYMHLVLICEHTIEVEAPDIDLVGIQLQELDDREKDLTAKFTAAKTEIHRQRQELLALENGS